VKVSYVQFKEIDAAIYALILGRRQIWPPYKAFFGS